MTIKRGGPIDKWTHVWLFGRCELGVWAQPRGLRELCEVVG